MFAVSGPGLGPEQTDRHGDINPARRSSQLCGEWGEDIRSDEPYARWKYKPGPQAEDPLS